MEKNCLITKLKGEIIDNSLIKVDEWKVFFKVPANFSSSIVISYHGTRNGTARVLEGDVLLSTSQEGTRQTDVQFTPGDAVYIFNDTNADIFATIAVSDKSFITMVRPSQASFVAGLQSLTESFKGQKLDYIPYLSGAELPSYNMYGTFNDLKGISSLILQNSWINITQDTQLSELKDFTAITNYGLQNSNGHHYIGNIIELAHNANITNLAFGQASLVSGTIEKFIAKQRWTAGRATGSFTGNSTNNSSVTFDGSVAKAIKGYSWQPNSINNENTDITSVDGVLVTIDRNGNKVS